MQQSIALTNLFARREVIQRDLDYWLHHIFPYTTSSSSQQPWHNVSTRFMPIAKAFLTRLLLEQIAP
jgi:hypothetical protein